MEEKKFVDPTTLWKLLPYDLSKGYYYKVIRNAKQHGIEHMLRKAGDKWLVDKDAFYEWMETRKV